MVAKITSKGQITLPKEIRELLGVGSGDSVRFEVHDGKIEVYPQKPCLDFRSMIGLLPRDDDMTAQEWQEDMRGDPGERACLRDAPPHPNVTRLGKLYGLGDRAKIEEANSQNQTDERQPA